mmetsp:Transcript_66570/g.192209  ORF Transcript_66570/g.192209 Transcript_66570/m.192209 type:complete len:301 (-) Transcript_66570:1426-2328(-)
MSASPFPESSKRCRKETALPSRCAVPSDLAPPSRTRSREPSPPRTRSHPAEPPPEPRRTRAHARRTTAWCTRRPPLQIALARRPRGPSAAPPPATVRRARPRSSSGLSQGCCPPRPWCSRGESTPSVLCYPRSRRNAHPATSAQPSASPRAKCYCTTPCALPATSPGACRPPRLAPSRHPRRSAVARRDRTTSARATSCRGSWGARLDPRWRCRRPPATLLAAQGASRRCSRPSGSRLTESRHVVSSAARRRRSPRAATAARSQARRGGAGTRRGRPTRPAPHRACAAATSPRSDGRPAC